MQARRPSRILRFMKRDFALRVDCLPTGVRASLDSIASYLKSNVPRGNLTDEEFRRYAVAVGRCMTETIMISNELHKLFPDIVPDELKSERS